ncbi:hypothetical protein OIU79_016186 [Salix purpurea]|uniref:Uncharacterized protein n=1 Tax=Salix purpurea TaxID=77065 RepID=A0A9Q0PDN9_SALPP|nr:hypothetical protein OIU79_016186 [Salix purpurea]
MQGQSGYVDIEYPIAGLRHGCETSLPTHMSSPRKYGELFQALIPSPIFAKGY